MSFVFRTTTPEVLLTTVPGTRPAASTPSRTDEEFPGQTRANFALAVPGSVAAAATPSRLRQSASVSDVEEFRLGEVQKMQDPAEVPHADLELARQSLAQEFARASAHAAELEQIRADLAKVLASSRPSSKGPQEREGLRAAETEVVREAERMQFAAQRGVLESEFADQEGANEQLRRSLSRAEVLAQQERGDKQRLHDELCSMLRERACMQGDQEALRIVIAEADLMRQNHASELMECQAKAAPLEERLGEERRRAEVERAEEMKILCQVQDREKALGDLQKLTKELSDDMAKHACLLSASIGATISCTGRAAASDIPNTGTGGADRISQHPYSLDRSSCEPLPTLSAQTLELRTVRNECSRQRNVPPCARSPQANLPGGEGWQSEWLARGAAAEEEAPPPVVGLDAASAGPSPEKRQRLMWTGELGARVSAAPAVHLSEAVLIEDLCSPD